MHSVAARDLYRTSGEARWHSMGLTLCSAEAEAGGGTCGGCGGREWVIFSHTPHGL
jgi:hypothetical protein